jgi:hypothetical protein
MSSSLQNLPGHRMAPDADQGSLLLELFPFLPDAFTGPMPIYVTIGLLYVVISRAERKRRRRKQRENGPAVPSTEALIRPELQTVGINPRLGAHGGHWGDG